VAICLDADIFPSTTGNAGYSVGLGNTFADDAALIGAMFEKKSTDTNWFAVCGNGAALSARVDTGVPAIFPSGYQMRVEWLGSGVADNSVAACRFYIGGFLVATITSNLPSAATTPAASVFAGLRRTSSTGQELLFLGPIRYSAGY
jgi:hypothetical protein